MAEMQSFDAGLVFSGKATGTQVMGFDKPDPHVPAHNPDFIIGQQHMDVLAWAVHFSATTPLYYYGPTGCGKSSVLREIAARLNWPVYEITGHEALQAIDLAGHMALRGQDTVWQDGPLAQAMRAGGLLLFNELDAALPSATIALNTVLDGAPLCIEATGEVIRPHPMFRFAATGNTSGSGDAGEGYTGTARQNIALLDRFYVCRAAYMPVEQEDALLASAAPALPQDVRQTLRVVIDATRKASDDLVRPISTRAAVLWARAAYVFAPLRGCSMPDPVTGVDGPVNVLRMALDHAVGFKRPDAERNALHELLQRITGEE